MSDKKQLNYQKSLYNFLQLYRIIFFVLAAVMIFVIFRYKLTYGLKTGGFILTGCLIGLGVLSLINSFNHAEYDDNSLSVTKLFKTTTVAFKDITRVIDNGKAIEFYQGTKRLMKLSGMTYDVADLADLVGHIERHCHLKLEDQEKASALDHTLGNEKMNVVLLALGIFDMIYLLSAFIISTSNLTIFYIVSLIIPLFPFAYYVYLLLKGEIEVLLGYRLLFFMTLMIPALALAIMIAKTFTFGSPKTVFVFSICLFIVIDILYRLLSSLMNAGTDAFMRVYLFMIIPLLIIVLNINLPTVKSTSTTETITEISLQTSKVMLGYTIIAEDADGNTTHFNVPSNDITRYKVNQEVTVTRNIGPFGMTYITVTE